MADRDFFLFSFQRQVYLHADGRLAKCNINTLILFNSSNIKLVTTDMSTSSSCRLSFVAIVSITLARCHHYALIVYSSAKENVSIFSLRPSF